MRGATLMVGAVGVMVAVLGFAQTATWAQTGISAPSTALLRDASEGVYAVPQVARRLQEHPGERDAAGWRARGSTSRPAGRRAEG